MVPKNTTATIGSVKGFAGSIAKWEIPADQIVDYMMDHNQWIVSGRDDTEVIMYGPR